MAEWTKVSSQVKVPAFYGQYYQDRVNLGCWQRSGFDSTQGRLVLSLFLDATLSSLFTSNYPIDVHICFCCFERFGHPMGICYG